MSAAEAQNIASQSVQEGGAAAEAAPAKPEGTGQTQERLSPQFAALARKEKALRLEFQKLKQERDSWKQEQDKYKNTNEYIPKQRLMKETMSVLRENGLTADQVARMLLEGDSYSPSQSTQEDPRISQLLARIDELEGKTKSFETEFTEKEQREREQAVNQIRNEAKMLIDSSDDYATIRAWGKVDAVVDHITRTLDEDGILLSTEEAAKEVEELLVEEVSKLAALDKIKQRIMPQQAAGEPAVDQARLQSQQRSQPAIKTLTHEMTATAASKPLSEKERVRRAIMIAQGLDPATGQPRAK
jgi:hypothetical protein